MISFQSRHSQRLGATLALFAMLLIAMMPTIARAIAIATGDGAMFQTICTHGAAKLVLDPSMVDGDQSDVSNLDKCGYCTMHQSLPFVALSVVSALHLHYTYELPERFYSAAAKSYAWNSAQARAPPA